LVKFVCPVCGRFWGKGFVLSDPPKMVCNKCREKNWKCNHSKLKPNGKIPLEDGTTVKSYTCQKCGTHIYILEG